MAPCRARRNFSVISVHSSFPATLYRFQPLRQSSLYNSFDRGSNIHDGVLLGDDGLISPRVSADIPFSNGAMFMPNTFMMQELMRTFFDQYTENSEDKNTPEKPVVICIRRGVSVPNSLVLLREYLSRFSLQPSQPVSLGDLNKLLDEFYSKHATITALEEWLDQNEYHEAADDASADWVGK